jgi:hypothetical protein
LLTNALTSIRIFFGGRPAGAPLGHTLGEIKDFGFYTESAVSAKSEAPLLTGRFLAPGFTEFMWGGLIF